MSEHNSSPPEHLDRKLSDKNIRFMRAGKHKITVTLTSSMGGDCVEEIRSNSTATCTFVIEEGKVKSLSSGKTNVYCHNPHGGGVMYADTSVTKVVATAIQ